MAANSPSFAALKRDTRSATGIARAFRISPEEERSLILHARAGDARALERLVELLAGPIYRFGRGFCGDPHDAEDVAQVVLMAVVRTLKDFRGEASLTTWAYTVARRACARHRRRPAGGPRRIVSIAAEGPGRSALEVADPRQDPARDLERRDLARALEQAIASLPPGQREVLVLRDVEGLPARQVAKALRLGERAVKSRLHRARAALRAALVAYGTPGGGRRAGRTGDGAAARARRSPRRRADCPDIVRILSRHLEGELDPSVCARIERHVAGCMDCGAACETLRGALIACRSWRSQRLPAALERSLRRATREAAAALRAGR
jgi:RNA polymerase sigma-70 factor (ECF subfamily)